jgi:hypothetical protein
MKMKLTYLLAPVILAGLAVSARPYLDAAPQQAIAVPAGVAQTAAPVREWTTEQAVTSSVREAWRMGGRTSEGFFEIVKVLTEISAEKRGVTIPESQQAGVVAGNWIRKQAKKDPDQLLYVIVDQAVQHSANRTAAK